MFNLFTRNKAQSWQDVTPDEVQNLITNNKDLQLIDVREVDEYKSGHIPEAKLVPLSQIDLRHQEIDPNKQTVVVCRSGGRSKKACDYLSKMGHSNLQNMTGGMLGWKGNVKTN